MVQYTEMVQYTKLRLFIVTCFAKKIFPLQFSESYFFMINEREEFMQETQHTQQTAGGLNLGFFSAKPHPHPICPLQNEQCK